MKRTPTNMCLLKIRTHNTCKIVVNKYSRGRILHINQLALIINLSLFVEALDVQIDKIFITVYVPKVFKMTFSYLFLNTCFIVVHKDPHSPI